jgi:Cof subfamily protein (haloacid dehalogenase superfamily)
LKYKLIVTDLDDTLLREDLTISDRSKRAICKARENGIHVVLATGRMFPSAVPYARELNLTGPIICCQGAQIADIRTGRPIRITAIPRALGAEILRFAQDAGIYAQYYSQEEYFFEQKSEESEYYHHNSGVEGKALGRKPSEALDIDPIKILLMAEPQRIRQAHALAAERFGDRLSVTISKSCFLEFTHLRADKGSAVEELAAMLKVPPEQVMAVGDAPNDLPMLRFAGLGVAMGNGGEDVKGQADAVTSSNMEEGVAAAIEKYALGE